LEFRKPLPIFPDRNRRYRYFSESVIGILDRNRYRNLYCPLPTVFFGYRFGSEFTEFKIRNLPKLLTSPAQIPNSQLIAHGPASSPPRATHLSSARRTNVDPRPSPSPRHSTAAQAHRTQPPPPVAIAHCFAQRSMSCPQIP
jgi:hypothetical protein